MISVVLRFRVLSSQRMLFSRALDIKRASESTQKTEIRRCKTILKWRFTGCITSIILAIGGGNFKKLPEFYKKYICHYMSFHHHVFHWFFSMVFPNFHLQQPGVRADKFTQSPRTVYSMRRAEPQTPPGGIQKVEHVKKNDQKMCFIMFYVHFRVQKCLQRFVEPHVTPVSGFAAIALVSYIKYPRSPTAHRRERKKRSVRRSWLKGRAARTSPLVWWNHFKLLAHHHSRPFEQIRQLFCDFHSGITSMPQRWKCSCGSTAPLTQVYCGVCGKRWDQSNKSQGNKGPKPKKEAPKAAASTDFSIPSLGYTLPQPSLPVPASQMQQQVSQPNNQAKSLKTLFHQKGNRFGKIEARIAKLQNALAEVAQSWPIFVQRQTDYVSQQHQRYVSAAGSKRAEHVAARAATDAGRPIGPESAIPSTCDQLWCTDVSSFHVCKPNSSSRQPPCSWDFCRICWSSNTTAHGSGPNRILFGPPISAAKHCRSSLDFCCKFRCAHATRPPSACASCTDATCCTLSGSPSTSPWYSGFASGHNASFEHTCTATGRLGRANSDVSQSFVQKPIAATTDVCTNHAGPKQCRCPIHCTTSCSSLGPIATQPRRDRGSRFDTTATTTACRVCRTATTMPATATSFQERCPAIVTQCPCSGYTESCLSPSDSCYAPCASDTSTTAIFPCFASATGCQCSTFGPQFTRERTASVSQCRGASRALSDVTSGQRVPKVAKTRMGPVHSQSAMAPVHNVNQVPVPGSPVSSMSPTPVPTEIAESDADLFLDQNQSLQHLE